MTGQASPQLVRFVAQFEGFSATLYNDPAQHCTIGFGHLVHKGPCNGQEPAEFLRSITVAQGEALMRTELAATINAVLRLISVPLNRTQLDALVSFTYNAGQGALATSTLRKKLNAGDYASVPTELNRWIYGEGRRLPGLVRRRAAEGRLFATGDYGDLTVPYTIIKSR
jgi:lysozyme